MSIFTRICTRAHNWIHTKDLYEGSHKGLHEGLRDDLYEVCTTVFHEGHKRIHEGLRRLFTRAHKRKASFQTGLSVAFTVRVFCFERFLGSGISFSFT